MDSLSWLQVCGEGQTEGCIPTVQVIYLIAVIVGVVLVAIIGRRSRDLSTSTLSLMPVAIAINIAVGSIAVALRLPIYLDSIGTVLVGVLAGPWAGALTGLLSNLIWSILPVPGGAGPTIAFFAPVAGVIGLMAGFWASQGVFRLRTDDERVGRFLALAAGIGAAAIAMLVIQQTIGLTFDFEDLGSQTQFVTLGADHRRGRRRCGRVANRTQRVRLPGERSAHPALPVRCDRDQRVRAAVRAAPPAVRTERLLLRHRRSDRRRHARRLPRRREPHRPRAVRSARLHRRARRRGDRRVPASGPGRGAARTPGCSRSGSVASPRASLRP